MIIPEKDYLMHYGTPRHSGRYPWGSGGDIANQRNVSLLDIVKELKKQGMTEAAIAESLQMTTTQLRAQKSIAKTKERQDKIARVRQLKQKGVSNSEIARQTGYPESTVRTLLAPDAKDKADALHTTAGMLKEAVDKKGNYIQIGEGVENQLGISQYKLKTAAAVLQEQGYTVHNVQIDQLGTGEGMKTYVKVLCPPGTSYRDVVQNMDKIDLPTSYSHDGGRTYFTPQAPLSIASKRVGVNYAEDGGSSADGVIYVRPGVRDVSIGQSRYAQVRILVDGTHYIKGMAVYKDDLPAGKDLVFNTNKSKTSRNIKDVLKPIEEGDNPFKASISHQITETGRDGKEKVTSVMNMVHREGDWDTWSNSLSSQMLSKQRPELARSQLDMTHERYRNNLDEVKALENPVVRRRLLEDLANQADASAVHLEAASMPRQRTQVILPMSSLKPTEIYAPNYRNGERVVLIRHPHAGPFEIPELTVNNRHPESKKMLGDTSSAVAIHPKVAKHLSGADFDGDTVLVIPNNKRSIKTASPLEDLKNFDPIHEYPATEGMKVMTEHNKQMEMGKISNLITDMTIHGASHAELARAVKHSMVVIDAEKHNLDYKRSEEHNGIAALRAKYQPKPPGKGGRPGGASTLLSRSNAEIRVPRKIPRPIREGGPIDRATGKLVFKETGESYIVRSKTGREKVVPRTMKSRRGAETDDAFTLSSGTHMESIYAEHANKLKALANEARLAAVHTESHRYSPSAFATYRPHVDRLNAALKVAVANKPLERQAQIVGNLSFHAKRQANPQWTAEDIKKNKAKEIAKARVSVGAKKYDIVISPEEWHAIQAGAITGTKLTEIMRHADIDELKKLATPRKNLVMTDAKTRRAKAMLASGYTQSEVADALGVALSTLKSNLSEGKG